jgi:ribosomal protein S18 acetylase RimI-like enzyme
MAQTDIMLRPADSDVETSLCWPLMRLLRPHLTSVEMFVAQLARQRLNGYRLLVVWDAEDAVALAGWRVQENFVYGLYLYVDDLVTRPDSRGQAFGGRLLAKLAEEGRALGCSRLVLDTATTNIAAQRFYTRQGLRNQSLGFSSSLSSAK